MSEQTKYKFKVQPEIPSAEKIEQHKDFKRLRANYDEAVKPLYKRPLYRDPKALIVVIVILLLTWILVEVAEKEEKEQLQINKEAPRQ